MACKLAEFGRHFSIMLAVHTCDDPLRCPHVDFLSRKNLPKGVTQSVSASSERVTLRDKEPALFWLKPNRQAGVKPRR